MSSAGFHGTPSPTGMGFRANSWHFCGDRRRAPWNRPSGWDCPSLTYGLPPAAVPDRCSGSPRQMGTKTDLLARLTARRPLTTR